MPQNIFSQLSSTLKGFVVELGLTHPTQIQNLAIPVLLKGKNALLVSPTGSGKTEAAVIPLLQQLLGLKFRSRRGISFLYITPLRALNRDIFRRLVDLGKKIGVNIQIRHGDTTQRVRRLQALKPPDILITTPETLQAILPALRMREHLRDVHWVVVDELHELVDNKRGSQLSMGLERLKILANRPIQFVGLSATIGDPLGVAKFLVSPTQDVEIIQADPFRQMSVSVEHPQPTLEDKEIAEKLNINVDIAARIRRISQLIEEHKTTLLFSNTRQGAELIGLRLKLHRPDLPIAIHHGSLSKTVRFDAETDLKAGKLRCVVCTSSLELGIDIGEIDLVIQVSSPRQITKLIQRVGRAGHTTSGLAKGVVITGGIDDILEAGVIIAQAKNSKIESQSFWREPLDVLAHQVSGILLDQRRIDFSQLYQILRRSWAFHKLAETELDSVISLMRQLDIVYRDQDQIRLTRKTRLYYYSNLSVIPDSKQFKIMDMVSQRPIGVLDQEYVVRKGQKGELFIIRGTPWRIVNRDEETVFVEPVMDLSASVPSWVGTMIPVPFAIAHRVGKIRGTIANSFSKPPNKAPDLRRLYLDHDASNKVVELIQAQIDDGEVVPTDKTVLIEQVRDQPFIILHTCFGSKANQTFGRLVAGLLSAQKGFPIAMRSLPYAIVFQIPPDVILHAENVKNTIMDLNPKHVALILERMLQNTGLFQWHFLHIAKRFGIIQRSVNYDQVNIPRLIEAYLDSPVTREAINEIKKQDFDVTKTIFLVRQLKKGKILIHTSLRSSSKGFSPLSLEQIKNIRFEDVISPAIPTAAIINTLKKRLLNKQVRLVCLYCTNWDMVRTIETLNDHPTCPRCNSRFIASTYRSDNELRGIARKAKQGKKLTNEEEYKLKKAKQVASLILSNGKRAVMALAGRGVGPKTVRSILSRGFENDEEFYKEILRVERSFVRTREFWDAR